VRDVLPVRVLEDGPVGFAVRGGAVVEFVERGVEPFGLHHFAGGGE